MRRALKDLTADGDLQQALKDLTADGDLQQALKDLTADGKGTEVPFGAAGCLDGRPMRVSRSRGEPAGFARRKGDSTGMEA